MGPFQILFILILVTIILIIFNPFKKFRIKKIRVDKFLIHDGIMSLIFNGKPAAFLPGSNKYQDKIDLSLDNIEWFRKSKFLDQGKILTQWLLILFLMFPSYRSLNEWIKNGAPLGGPSPAAMGELFGYLLFPLILTYIIINHVSRIYLYSRHRILKIKLKKKIKRYQFIEIWIKSEDEANRIVEFINKDSSESMIFCNKTINNQE